MSKFSNAVAGVRKRTPAQLQLINGDQVPVDIRMLTPMESVAVLEDATRFAQKRGAAAVEDGNPIYDLGLYVHTLALAVLDPEVREEESPYFDGGADQILNSPLLGRDSIAHLFALYEEHVDRMALSPREMTEDGLKALIESCAEGDMLPFSKLRPGMQWSYTHSSARLLRSLLRAKSSSGPGSESGTSEPSKMLESSSSSNGAPEGG